MEVPDHRQGALIAHSRPHVQLAVLPQGQFNGGVLHGPPDVPLIVRHRQQGAQRTAALDLQGHAGPVLFQRVAHHGRRCQSPTQGRGRHREGPVDLPRPFRQPAGGNGGGFHQAVFGDSPYQFIAHSDSF